MKPRHPVPLKCFHYQGQFRYFLTFCTHARRRVFTSDPVVSLVWSQILRATSREAFAVVAYCFMPDHLHMLVQGLADDSDLRRFVARAKQFSGYAFARQQGTVLWQRYGYERTLRREDLTPTIVRYILQNPVRAGLVERPEEYPYLGSSVYTRTQLMDGVMDQ